MQTLLCLASRSPTDCFIMDGGDEGNLVIKKRFVSEAELDERRKRRQEEWEKVRKPEDPEECPEEVYDPRSLFERLQEQKDRKQQEYEEQFRFKNMVRGLDEDETNFLDEVSRQQELIEKQRREEEMKELKEYRISFVF
ncbi:PSME3-interacting protein [Manis javanica]|nr:PSME3-interacting protein [Manis javanica]